MIAVEEIGVNDIYVSSDRIGTEWWNCEWLAVRVQRIWTTNWCRHCRLQPSTNKRDGNITLSHSTDVTRRPSKFIGRERGIAFGIHGAMCIQFTPFIDATESIIFAMLNKIKAAHVTTTIRNDSPNAECIRFCLLVFETNLFRWKRNINWVPADILLDVSARCLVRANVLNDLRQQHATINRRPSPHIFGSDSLQILRNWNFNTTSVRIGILALFGRSKFANREKVCTFINVEGF